MRVLSSYTTLGSSVPRASSGEEGARMTEEEEMGEKVRLEELKGERERGKPP